MVWVVDGTRLKRDYLRFLKGKKDFRTIGQGIFYVEFTDECFPSNWLGSLVPVIFDFRGAESIVDPNDMRNRIYCLFPNQIRRYSPLAGVPRKAFINSIFNGDWLLRTRNFIDKLVQEEHERQNQNAIRNNIIF